MFPSFTISHEEIPIDNSLYKLTGYFTGAIVLGTAIDGKKRKKRHMDSATVSSKFQVVIPRKTRDVLGLKAGDKLIFDYRDGVVAILARPADFVEFMRGLGSEVWKEMDVSRYLRGERAT